MIEQRREDFVHFLLYAKPPATLNTKPFDSVVIDGDSVVVSKNGKSEPFSFPEFSDGDLFMPFKLAKDDIHIAFSRRHE